MYNEKGKRKSSLTSMQSRRANLVSLLLFDQIDCRSIELTITSLTQRRLTYTVYDICYAANNILTGSVLYTNMLRSKNRY